MTMRRSRSLAATLGGGLLLLVACSAGPSSEPSGATATADPTPTAVVTASPHAGETEVASPTATPTFSVQTYRLPSGSGPHDVAPAADGGVWYTAQTSGELGWLNPENGAVREVPLGPGSAPHGVIVGPDGMPWITDGGLNAIVRVDPASGEVTRYPLPSSASNANLNTAAFDGDGVLWFTGQAGYYGRLDPATGDMDVFNAPRGLGPYGITATRDGEIYYSSLAGSYLGAVNRQTRRPPARACAGPGPIRAAGSGSASGTPGR
jgi:streptogramin lyase